MKIGYTLWTWIVEADIFKVPDTPEFRILFEQGCRDISNLGFQTVENFGFMVRHYENDIALFQETLEKNHLEFAALYHYISDDFSSDCEKASKYASFLEKTGGKVLVTQGNMWREPPIDRPINIEVLKKYVKHCEEMGRITNDHGIRLCMHPHGMTPVFHQEEIDYFLDQTNPTLVSLCMDPAHIQLAGMNAAQAAERFAARIGYVHLKDCDPDPEEHPEWPLKRFRALGEGVVDFKGVKKALLQHGFDGTLAVELDYPRINNYESASVSRTYIRNVLGV